MKRRTITTLSELRMGDRFVLVDDKRQTVQEVYGDGTGKRRPIVQATIKPDYRERNYKNKRLSTKVLFLRHTVILPGEECFIEDLIKGDVFYKPDDIVHEYEIVEPHSTFYDVRRLDKNSTDKAGRLATVIFVRHKE